MVFQKDRTNELSFVPTIALSLSAAFVSTVVSHPFEFLKTKIQIYNEGIGLRGRQTDLGYNPYTVYRNFLKNNYTSKVLYTGLREGIMARLSYIGARNVTYKLIYDRIKPKKLTNDLSAYEKSVLGAISGAVGAIAGNMFECQMVRKIGDIGRKQKYVRENVSYNNMSGLKYNIMRAVLLNMSMMVPYNYGKEKMYQFFGDVWPNKIVALFYASFIGSMIVLPFDNLKTRVQNLYMQQELNRLKYTENLFYDLFKIAKHEGFATFWAGGYCFYAKNLLYAMCTVYMCDYWIDKNSK